jgi:hypothetical protein
MEKQRRKGIGHERLFREKKKITQVEKGRTGNAKERISESD